MSYEINDEKYFINIYDTPNNIKLWLDCLDIEVMHGIFQREFKKEINNLENITDFIIETTASTRYDRIYFQRNRILYRPNSTSMNTELYWSLLKKKFERTKQLFEKRNKE